MRAFTGEDGRHRRAGLAQVGGVGGAGGVVEGTVMLVVIVIMGGVGSRGTALVVVMGHVHAAGVGPGRGTGGRPRQGSRLCEGGVCSDSSNTDTTLKGCESSAMGGGDRGRRAWRCAKALTCDGHTGIAQGRDGRSSQVSESGHRARAWTTPV